MITRMARHAEKYSRMNLFLARFSTSAQLIASVHILFIFVIIMFDSLDYAAKTSLFAFLSAITLWSATNFILFYLLELDGDGLIDLGKERALSHYKNALFLFVRANSR